MYLNYEKIDMLGYSKFTFFYQSASPFSNWHPSPFTVNKTKFATSEQFMMFGKAMLFGDLAEATNIMESDDPRENKKVSRFIRGFKPTIWDKHCKDVVYVACLNKFTQNPKMLKELQATDGTLLVEASPTDRVWGIGIAEDHRDINEPKKWKGLNKLGEVLTRLRDDLKAGKPAPAGTKLVEEWFK